MIRQLPFNGPALPALIRYEAVSGIRNKVTIICSF